MKRINQGKNEAEETEASPNAPEGVKRDSIL
jgi:hypothetical protein